MMIRKVKIQLVRDALNGNKVKVDDMLKANQIPYVPQMYFNFEKEEYYTPDGTDLKLTSDELVLYHEQRGWLPPVICKGPDDD